MKKKTQRDWSEWKEHITGMHRLDSNFEQRHLGQAHRQMEVTSTAISFRDFADKKKEEPKLLLWLCVFIGILMVRMTYFELTKHDRIKSRSSISRNN